MKISEDKQDNAVRFDVEFTPGTDFWAYPVIRLQTNELLSEVDEIRFDFKAVQKNKEAGYRHAYVMFGKEQPFYALPAPTEEYQPVVIKIAETVKKPKDVRDIRIGLNPRDTSVSFWIKNLKFMTSRKVRMKFDAADSITMAAPGSVFIQGEALEFKLKPLATVSSEWVLNDWQGKTLARGQWPGDGRDSLKLEPLPNGYYKLTLSSDKADFNGYRSFAVVPDPDKAVKNPDMYFAVDSAQSWLARPASQNPRQPPNPYEVVSEVARRAGVQMVRERLSWAETEPSPGKFDWKQYALNANLLAERGVSVSGMYHNAPQWAKRNTTHLPADLAATYNYAKKVAEVFKGKMTVWEFWNEQDIGFAPESAWDYASALKAASLGFKSVNPDIPVAIGGYAITPVPAYADVVMLSEAGKYFDIFNIHTYRPITDYESVMKSIREHLTRHGISNHPVWFTELGSNIEGSGRSDSFIAGVKAHSSEQELVVAEYVSKSMITMQSLGVDRCFFFVLPPYNENAGNKDWGLMRRDFTVKPGYVALATLINRLGNAVLEGEVNLNKNIRAYLYRQADGGMTLAYWSKSEHDAGGARPGLNTANKFEQTFALPGSGTIKGVDFLGVPFEANRSAITATRFPAFLDNVGSLAFSKSFKAPILSKTGTGEYDKTIVFRTKLSDDFKLFAAKDGVDIKDGQAQFKLQVWNLSNRNKQGSVNISGGTVSGLPERITVAPFNKTELELMFKPVFDDKFHGTLKVDGVFDGNPATSLVIPFMDTRRMAAAGRQVEMPQLLDPVNWRKNSSGKMNFSYDAQEQGICFKIDFPPRVDRWAYPEYVLQLPQESMANATGISFEVKVSDAKAVKQMLVMAVHGTEKEGGKSTNMAVSAPGQEWQERFVPIPSNLDPAQIKQLRIGLNSLRDDISYWIRNVKFCYSR